MEPIKQEIINNIFENGDKLITGPILQTVLIDMIDDVNVKDQEILSKTGSWDEAVTQIPNLATKEEVTNLSESIARDLENVDLTGYATEAWVQDQGYLKEHQDISGLATKTELTEAENNLQGNITSLSESVARDLASVPEGVATEAWVQSQGYLTEHQDISGLATKTELTEAKDNLQGNITSLSESVARDLANVSVPEGVATEAWVQSQDYASKTYVDSAVSSSSVDLTGYATETWVQNQGYLKEHQDISGLATKTELNLVSQSVQTDISNLATKTELNDTKNNLQGNITSLSESVARDLANVDVDLTGYATETWVQSQGYLKEHQDISGLATKSELTSVSESVQTDITNLSESVANSAVWKKGEGQDSIVQKLTGDDEAYTPTATGIGAVAIGSETTASGQASHAEGTNTNALGDYSHAEGLYTTAYGQASHAEGDHTNALGDYSHAEGYQTEAPNSYECALGMCNHSSEGQIFSVGAGEGDPYNPFDPKPITRRNAISVLAVPNSDTQINTASVFVQNVGGYDGTNPIPGTNDLATVINNLPSGGSSETLWKKGTGKDSVVQILTGDDEANTPTASGTGAIAIGSQTTASGYYSYAEGDNTNAEGESSHAEGYKASATGRYGHAEGDTSNASGLCSHAEGQSTLSSGQASHAEGFFTVASNDYEHAQGQYNHNSTNQIFSVGAGEKIGETVTRRNAVSILEVPNSETQVVTASFFVQNVGGYDGTNPEPGTNDLATVISKVSSIWEKGTGQDSIVQVIADPANLPTASGLAAVAMGLGTEATGDYSHAEGKYVLASGSYSHAEGQYVTSSGEFSHAEGWTTEASNQASHAEGETTKALGRSSHAEGKSTTASGSWSHAEGDSTRAEGNASHAEGQQTFASGDYSHAEGYATFALSSYSHAEGQQTQVPGWGSHAEGEGTIASGSFSHAEGRFTRALGDYSHAEGRHTTASGEGSHAEGYHTNASKYASHAEGDHTNALENYSHAEGRYTTASGLYSHAEGDNTNASQAFSHTEGGSTIASGWGSHAEGNYTTASGHCSHAEGSGSNASQAWSHTEGRATVTSNEYEHAQGRYNYTSSNQIFSIGTGNSDTDRRNAVSVLEVDNSGSYTSSFFVQNIGGYDGTNPTPGTNDLATVINSLSSSGGSSETLWKKGEGQDSLVQAIADGTNLPTATGNRAIATGMSTTASEQFSHAEGSTTVASGYSSHAEGQDTNASGPDSHAEGDQTKASGMASHAEGIMTEASGDDSHAEGAGTKASGMASHAEGAGTIASNDYSHAEGSGTIASNANEHAQGMFNHNSENQIFSVGVGEGDPTDPATATRRNAISILAVPNETTWINTGSVFIQNIGGYDGTNPTPGTNDLATVINGMAIEGGIGTSSETWTFTLEDGTTVTKTIVMR